MDITTPSPDFVNCTYSGEDVICNGTTYILPEMPLNYTDTWFWIFIGIYVGLVLFAGVMSGLTLGMLSLDMMTLKVLQEAGSPREKKYASRIMPVVKRHHLLLVTLLLANAVAVESMPLCLDRVSDPITAIVVSVSAVLLFGEVFPQALCSRYGLAIGATMVPLVYLLMGVFFIVAWPISKLLDCLLGAEHSTFFRRAELKALVGLHGPDDEFSAENPADGPLSIDEVLIIKGALELRDKTAQDAMVPLESVFMVEINEKLDRSTMKKILQTAHSRVPVYEGERDNVLGVLLVKTLIMLDPEDAEPVSKLVRNPCYSRQVTYLRQDKPLFDILNEFQTGKSHLAFVLRQSENDVINKDMESLDFASSQPPGTTVVGIITLEDIIEELLQEEIIDETDVYVDVHKRVRVARARAKQFTRSNSAFNTPFTTPALTPNRTPIASRKGSGSKLSVPSTSQGGRRPASDLSGTDSPTTPLLTSQET